MGKKRKPITVKELFGRKDIELSITTTSAGWKELDYLYSKEPKVFEYELYSFIGAAHEKSKRARSNRQAFISIVKSKSRWLYVYINYWIKKPKDKWPDPINRIIASAKKAEEEERLLNTKGKYGATEITAYCIDKFYGTLLKTYKLNPTKNIDNFYITYISDAKGATKIRNIFFKDKTLAEIRSLAYRPPLKEIFVYLKLI